MLDVYICAMLSRQLRVTALQSAALRTGCGQGAITYLALRTYAQVVPPTQAASAPDSKPPVALFGLDGTYASALVCSKAPF